MFAPRYCCNQPDRFSQRRWRNSIILPLTFFFALFVVNAITHAQEPQSPFAPPAESPAYMDNSADAPSDSTPTIKNNTDVKSAARKKAKSKDADKEDRFNDRLILSYSSDYIFLSRKKTRDIVDNSLDYWYYTSFEENLNLILIEFNFIDITPLNIDLDPDYASQIALEAPDSTLINNYEQILAESPCDILPVPESVLRNVGENADEIVDISHSFLPETMSASSYFILCLAILGFAILGCMIYKLIVWAFMLDQNKEYDVNKAENEDFIVPVNMDAYSAFFYQTDPDDNEE